MLIEERELFHQYCWDTYSVVWSSRLAITCSAVIFGQHVDVVYRHAVYTRVTIGKSRQQPVLRFEPGQPSNSMHRTASWILAAPPTYPTVPAVLKNVADLQSLRASWCWNTSVTCTAKQ